MKIIFEIGSEGVREAEVDGLELFVSNDIQLWHSKTLTDSIEIIAKVYEEDKLESYLNDNQNEHDIFLLIIADAKKKALHIFNDYFGSNEMFYARRGGDFFISNSIKDLFKVSGVVPSIRENGVYEHLVFQSITPPDTIFEDVYAIDIASCTSFASGDVSSHIYWDVDVLLQKKREDYDQLVKDSREALQMSLKCLMPSHPAMALSGGIDSGGLLGMATRISGQPIPSISVGGHGPETIDLDSARKTAQFNKSKNVEIYPSYESLQKLKKLCEDLNQPSIADLLYPYSLIHEKASQIGANGIIYGFGAEMLLGNLKISKIAYTISKVEQIVPRKVMEVLYNFAAGVFKLSDTQKAFLLSFSWPERFMYARGALYIWEKNYFTKDQTKFWDDIKRKVFVTMEPSQMNIVDRISKAYLFSWVNFIQLREFYAITKRFKIIPVLPFDTPRLVVRFFSATNKIRKKNKWNKMLIRDVMKPFVADHLYSNTVRSMIVPYNKVLKGKEALILTYIKESPILKNVIDFQKVERELNSMLEPGLFLMRMMGLALWYDVNWNKSRVIEFDKLFE